MSQQAQKSQTYSGALARVQASSSRISHLRDELRAEYERRGQAVVDAVAEGHSYRTIGHAASVEYATVYKIMTDWA